MRKNKINMWCHRKVSIFLRFKDLNQLQKRRVNRSSKMLHDCGRTIIFITGWIDVTGYATRWWVGDGAIAVKALFAVPKNSLRDCTSTLEQRGMSAFGSLCTAALRWVCVFTAGTRQKPSANSDMAHQRARVCVCVCSPGWYVQTHSGVVRRINP